MGARPVFTSLLIRCLLFQGLLYDLELLSDPDKGVPRCMGAKLVRIFSSIFFVKFSNYVKTTLLALSSSMECSIFVCRTDIYTERCVCHEPGDLYLTLYYTIIKSHSVRRFVRHQLMLCTGHVRRTHLSFHTGLILSLGFAFCTTPRGVYPSLPGSVCEMSRRTK